MQRNLLLSPAYHQALRARSCPLHSTSKRSMASHSPFPRRQTSRSYFKPLNILAAAVPVTTFFLGVWQVKRLNWKLNLIEEVQRNLEREPMVLPDIINIKALPDFAFRRVLLQGTFSGPEILQGPVVKDGVPGYNLILPFHRSPLSSSSPTSTPSSSPFRSSTPSASAPSPSSPSTSSSSDASQPTTPSTILLNRGFITSTRGNAIRRREIPVPGVDEGEVIVEGMLTKRFSVGKGSEWQPDNVPEKGEWFWRDVEAMANFAGGDAKGVQPVLVDVIGYGDQPTTMLMQEGVPVGIPPIVEIRNQHATYAVTWFSLSAATSIMLFYVLKRGKVNQRLPTNLRGRL